MNKTARMLLLVLIAVVAACGGSDEQDGESELSIAQPATNSVSVESQCLGYTNTYCVTVSLMSGAKLKPFVASAPIDGTAGCNGWSNRFSEKSVAEFTNTAVAYDGLDIRNATAVISGSFHNDGGKPAFPLRVKEGGWIATYGYECRSDMRMLSIRNSAGRAFIEPFNLNKFKGTQVAPEVIVGLSPSTDKNASGLVGRNFVGLKDPYNGGFGTVVFVVSKSLKSATAITILKQKGCSDAQMMQLDGSTTAQLSRKQSGVWSALIPGTRQMPSVLGVFQ